MLQNRHYVVHKDTSFSEKVKFMQKSVVLPVKNFIFVVACVHVCDRKRKS